MLRLIAGGSTDRFVLDWLVVQHLKQKGFVEDTGTGPKITAKGKRAISESRV